MAGDSGPIVAKKPKNVSIIAALSGLFLLIIWTPGPDNGKAAICRTTGHAVYLGPAKIQHVEARAAGQGLDTPDVCPAKIQNTERRARG
jgi:hypothetical protein